jgi:hypothetical protein
LTAGLLSPVRADATLPSQRQARLDRLYQRVVDYLDALIHPIGPESRVTCALNANKIPATIAV